MSVRGWPITRLTAEWFIDLLFPLSARADS
jgi:hypothetical protein